MATFSVRSDSLFLADRLRRSVCRSKERRGYIIGQSIGVKKIVKMGGNCGIYLKEELREKQRKL